MEECVAGQVLGVDAQPEPIGECMDPSLIRPEPRRPQVETTGAMGVSEQSPADAVPRFEQSDCSPGLLECVGYSGSGNSRADDGDIDPAIDCVVGAVGAVDARLNHRVSLSTTRLSSMARPSGRDLRTELIKEATVAIQTDGTSFSFNQLADRLGVRAPSLHHHFRRKADLIDAAATAYIDAFESAVDRLVSIPACDRLSAYVDLFTAPAREGKFCLCGALTADWQDASPPVREQIARFFDGQLTWVAATAEQAQADGEVRKDLAPDAFARGLIAALEGALLLARVSPDIDVADGPRALLRLAASQG